MWMGQWWQEGFIPEENSKGSTKLSFPEQVKKRVSKSPELTVSDNYK